MTNELSAKEVSRVLSNDEVKAKQELALSENYNSYISAKRQVMESLFSEKTKSFVEKNVTERNEIWFQGSYLPVVILYATQEEIEAFAKNPDVIAIDPFVIHRKQPHQLEYTIGTFDIYDLTAVFTAIDATKNGQNLKVSISWRFVN